MHPSNTYFHFSFANYYDPTNMNFGMLRVINDDAIVPHSGFDKHPHQDMQIISYIIDGYLTHWDNVTNTEETIGAGHVQAISAGDGVWHSEINAHDVPCRLLQIWILPPYRGGQVRYTNKAFAPEERENTLLHIVGNPDNKDSVPLYINSDANLYVSQFTNNEAEVTFKLEEGRQAYLNCISGSVTLKGYTQLHERDSIELTESDEITLSSESGDGHFIIIEMAK